MKVKEVIEKLKQMPQDAIVTHLWDGEPRTRIEFIWLARGKTDVGEEYVVTSDYNQPCYREESRPVGAPTEKESKYWEKQL